MDNIKRLYDICKVLKGNTINFYNNRIMSLNSDIYPISSISIIYVDTQLGLNDVQCISMEIFTNNIKEGAEYIPTQSIKGIKESNILNSFIEPTNIIFRQDNLRDIEDFNIAMSKKAKEGMSLIYVDRFPISICSSLIPLNKPDDISLEIYEDNIKGSFIAKFIINKKKFIINRYIRYLYL